ncbi:MAG: SPOR domain-containing protein [bacterium]
MSDLDNSNLTNEEENSGFSPSDSDNKSFSSNKESSANATGNKDWGQMNYTKPHRKTPLWPFLLVGAFVCLGLITVLAVSATRCNREEKAKDYEYASHFKGYSDNHTKEIAMNKHVVVETKRIYRHDNGINHNQPFEKCKPSNCKPMGKCNPNDCKRGGKCDPKDCKPGGKCDPKDCKPGGKCGPNACKSMENKSIRQQYNIKNCEEVEIQVVNNESPKIIRKALKPNQVIPAKLGKPTLQDNAKGLYVLQVYAALSKDDADAKYEEYKSKGVEKVWVSTFSKANVVWYRVRIGDFTTIAAADTKAKELGISTYWVDKIR